MWEFGAIRTKALIELTKIGLGAVEKVVLGRSYRVGKWLLEGYVELVQREATLCDADITAIGYYAVAQIFRMREEKLHTMSLGLGTSDYLIREGICKVFKKELEETDFRTVYS